MIVKDEMVSAALGYLAIEPHPVAIARKELTDAENRRKRVFAELYREQNGGTVKDREVAVEVSEDYQVALLEESDAAMKYEDARAKIRSSEMVCEIWRSENANARAAERVR